MRDSGKLDAVQLTDILLCIFFGEVNKCFEKLSQMLFADCGLHQPNPMTYFDYSSEYFEE